MIVYYNFLIMLGGVLVITTFFLTRKKSQSLKKLLFFLTFWSLFAAALLPFLFSFMHILPALFLILAVAVGGGYVIYSTSPYSGTPVPPGAFLPAVKEHILLPLKIEDAKPREVLLKNQAAFKVHNQIALEEPLTEKNTCAQASLEDIPSAHKEMGEVIALVPGEMTCSDLVKESFNAKEGGGLALSADLLKEALTRTDDISLKSLIYTELTSIYKEMGMYREAVELLEFFLTENYSKVSSHFLKHFKQQILYLQTLDDLLQKTEQPGLPFSSVPRLIKVRAEEVFKG